MADSLRTTADSTAISRPRPSMATPESTMTLWSSRLYTPRPHTTPSPNIISFRKRRFWMPYSCSTWKSAEVSSLPT